MALGAELDFLCERMAVVKKLIALLVVAGALVSVAFTSGCGTDTKKAMDSRPIDSSKKP